MEWLHIKAQQLHCSLRTPKIIITHLFWTSFWYYSGELYVFLLWLCKTKIRNWVSFYHFFIDALNWIHCLFIFSIKAILQALFNIHTWCTGKNLLTDLFISLNLISLRIWFSQPTLSCKIISMADACWNLTGYQLAGTHLISESKDFSGNILLKKCYLKSNFALRFYFLDDAIVITSIF